MMPLARAAALLALASCGAIRQEVIAPNILFFLSDDQRHDFLGCAGHPFLKTPALDALAHRGVRFTKAFVTTSTCNASRATFLTGLWERTHQYTSGTPPLTRAACDASYPAVLRRAGYRTGLVGKLDIGVPPGEIKMMFDRLVRLRAPYVVPQRDGTSRHLTEIIGDRALEFIQDTPGDRPFCLAVCFNAPHAEDGNEAAPFPHPAREDGLYAKDKVPPPWVSTDHWKTLPEFLPTGMHRKRWAWRWDTPEKYERNVRAYFRMITGMDRVVGRVLNALRERGLEDETIVIFAGDNGFYLGSRGFAGKWSHFDESLRIPLIILDPGTSPDLRGSTQEAMALNVDVPATILDAAGVDIPSAYQGRSLMPWVRGESPDDWRTDFFAEHLMDHPLIPKWEGVRGHRYMYARYFENLPEGEFLYDLQADPKQLTNLSAKPESAGILARLRTRCDALRDRYGGPYRKHGAGRPR